MRELSLRKKILVLYKLYRITAVGTVLETDARARQKEDAMHDLPEPTMHSAGMHNVQGLPQSVMQRRGGMWKNTNASKLEAHAEDQSTCSGVQMHGVQRRRRQTCAVWKGEEMMWRGCNCRMLDVYEDERNRLDHVRCVLLEADAVACVLLFFDLCREHVLIENISRTAAVAASGDLRCNAET